jgi:hypothetical protein
MTEETCELSIVHIIPTGVELAAVFIPGADHSTSVPEGAEQARLERVHALGQIEEVYGSNEPATSVMVLVPAEDGTIYVANMMEGYIGFVEIPSGMLLPCSVSLRDVDADVEFREGGVGVKDGKLVVATGEPLATAIDQVHKLVQRHNARTNPRPAAKVVSIGDKTIPAASPTEPAPAPIPEDPSPHQASTSSPGEDQAKE